MGTVEKAGDEEKQRSKSMSTDLNDYTIIKEGEAEILMHSKNEVFYNKTQVFILLMFHNSIWSFVCFVLYTYKLLHLGVLYIQFC